MDMKQSTKRNLMSKIWIIGGTTETFETAEKLLSNKKDIIITVATKYGLEEFAKFSPYLLQKRMKVKWRSFARNIISKR